MPLVPDKEYECAGPSLEWIKGLTVGNVIWRLIDNSIWYAALRFAWGC